RVPRHGPGVHLFTVVAGELEVAVLGDCGGEELVLCHQILTCHVVLPFRCSGGQFFRSRRSRPDASFAPTACTASVTPVGFQKPRCVARAMIQAASPVSTAEMRSNGTPARTAASSADTSPDAREMVARSAALRVDEVTFVVTSPT